MCIDYRVLNKVTIKNKYPIPLIADLFDQLGKERYFTKLDLRSGYYQVWIAEGDEAKTTCVTRWRSALSPKDEVEFLGHKIKDGGLMMDGAKIKAIQDWEPPTKVTELRSFLGLVNYYRRFIMGYSAIASPLKNLLKKNKAWIWDEECQAVFESLKKAVIEEPVLRLPDVTMPFELHTNASDFAVGGVLMQDGHPIAFESQKLNETERKYTVQEKEMTVVIHCLRIWRHYLLGLRFVIKTDNIATSYFQTQKKLSPKQARWQDFLAGFDYQLEYKPWKANVVADALSRKAEFTAITQDQFFLQYRIKEGLEHEPLAKKIIALAKDGRTRRFWLKGDMLFTKGDQLYVPKSEIHGALFDGVVQDYGDGLKLLHEFSSPNGRANGERECTIIALSSALWKSPFDLVTGRQPLNPNTLAASYEGSSPVTYKTMKEWHEQAELTQASLDKAAKKMKKWADEKRRHVEFEVGDQVMVKLLPQQFKPLRKVKEILSDRTIRRRGVSSYKEYLIKWRDLPDSEASWEAKDLLWQFADEIKRYHENGMTRTSRA
ncbi:retrovirus-related pol polyprotein from transposon 17.6 [Tanacetum coccineum]|uniref:Retrovirus-related pol polyprotein from transposon 17.6 n=1 Tax=Tanacetum coccineum TaxID=301880 RepID=A0ABQ5C5A4_9ASTR